MSGRITLEQGIDMLAKAAEEKANGNISAAARMLGLTRSQMSYRLENLNKTHSSNQILDPCSSLS